MLRQLRLALLMLSLTLIAAGCGGGDDSTSNPVDGGGGGPSDSSVIDGKAQDASGTSDATLHDGGVADTSAPDTGPVDAAPATFTIGGTVSGLAGSGLVLQDNAGDDLTVSANGAFTFAKPIAKGGSYAVTVRTPPSAPSQTCVVTGGTGTATANVTSVNVVCSTATFTVGGTVSGLSGSGLVLQDNGGDSLAVSASGAFTFATPVASGAAFNVTILTQPSSPAQVCSVSGGTGTIGAANVSSITVNCATNTYVVGGTVSGLSGTVVLKDNGGDALTLTSNGTFAFATPLASGSAYAVTVATQPSAPAQTGTVTAGTGSVVASNVTGVLVTCVTNTYTVGGSVTGLAGTVVLSNGTDSLSLTADGAFTFAKSVASGGTYAVTVTSQPSSPTQVCTVTAGSGSVTNANVTNVAVTCTTSKFTVGGTISGLVGSGLVLTNNGVDALSASGTSFTFATAIDSGSSFAVAIATQPSSPTQSCVVSGGTGTVGASNVTGVVINCTTNTFTVGGTVNGLVGSVVLQNNGADTLTITSTGSFAFAAPVASGGAYNVVVLTQPSNPTQVCTVTNGSGNVGSTNVTAIDVECVTQVYNVGGTVSGLANGASVVLQNNGGGNITLSTNTTFAFLAIPSGASYAITVSAQPSSPSQTCVVTNGSGTVGGADVTNVQVVCTTNTYAIGGAVSGLATGLVLQDNLGDDLIVGTNGPFTFATKVASGAPYAVTVKTQPSSPSQTCTVTAGSGTVGAADVTSVQVNCATNSYTVGGTITGLTGSVVLQNNGGSNLSATSGTFAFPPIPSGTAYAITVLANPTSPSQTCTVTSGGTGTVGGSNVTNVAIHCVANTFTIGGTLTGLFGGGTVVLQNNLGNNLSLSANGTFTFTTPVASGQPYSVTVLTQPSQAVVCTATNATGTVGNGNVTSVTINCVLYTSCLALQRAVPSLPSGTYPINIGGTGYLAYCDMVFDGGGWTQVYDQDVNVAPGYRATAAWAAGVNVQQPSSGQYSILQLLNTLKGGSAAFEFRLEWPTNPGAGYAQWRQVENPLASSALPTASSYSLSPAGQSSDCGTFRGLSLSTTGSSLLDGDTSSGCWWWAVGTSAVWNNGIPAYRYPNNILGTTHARLWMRTPSSSSFASTGADQAFTVPASITSVNVKLWGAGGGGGNQAASGGGFTTAKVAVTPGETLTVIVGSKGIGRGLTNADKTTYGGGGAGGIGGTWGGAGSGGGRSALRRAAIELLTAGGGGAGGDVTSTGAGGGLLGLDGSGTAHGGGGTQSAGGAGGVGNCNAQTGNAGAQFIGGNTAFQSVNNPWGAGAGGGGWFGGGSGGYQCGEWGSGGGGSGYIGGAGVTAATTTAGSGVTSAGANDGYYSAGIGVGGAPVTTGGSGQAVIFW